jgi:hypothetical protein
VRGVAPPYPGAFTAIGASKLRILRTRLVAIPQSIPVPAIYSNGIHCYAACNDGQTLRILEMDLDGTPLTAADFMTRFGKEPITLKTKSQ